jgi:drug/metabolite transporter (DMT)-like permease
MSKDALGLLLGFVGMVIFALTVPVTRIAVQSFDPVFVTVGRAAVAGSLALATLWARGRRVPERRHWPRLMLGAVLLIGGFPVCLALALTTAEASHGGVVLAIVPLGTAVAATLTGGERPSAGFWLCAVLGTAIVLGFVLKRSHGDVTAADLLFLAAAACAAFGYTAGGVLARSMPGWEVICWQLVLALPVTAALTLRQLPEIDWHAPAAAWASFAYVSVFSMFLGFFAWNAGLALGGVARVGQIQLLQTFVVLAGSWLLLNEHIDAEMLVFAAAVVAVVALGRRAQVARPAAEAAPPAPIGKDSR